MGGGDVMMCWGGGGGNQIPTQDFSRVHASLQAVVVVAKVEVGANLIYIAPSGI